MDDFHFGTYSGEGDMGQAVFKKSAAIPIFYKRSLYMPAASEAAGRPIHESFDFVKVITPGERDEVDRKVEPFDKRQWKAQWDLYVEGNAQDIAGTPLSMLFPRNPEIVDNMKVLRFHTVEQLAEASDHQISAIPMGGMAWREKARRMLDASKDSAKFHAIEARMDAQDVAVSELRSGKAAAEEEASSLRARLAELERENVDLLRQVSQGLASAAGGASPARAARRRGSASDAVGDVEIAGLGG